ncbi:MAG TPA: malto-oligosyltrehalose trehalohydrolase [Thermoanaerobaculia bacterium]|nr:malto-oligosyltrehalose trehalohydrolase [Thermoanaerobaculia bacterium]
MNLKRPSLGARVVAPGRCEFRVWSPSRERVELRIVAPRQRTIAMSRDAGGYHEAVVDAGEGARYYYVLDGVQRPDPASRFQPVGVHGASEVVDSTFDWHDAHWKGLALQDFVIYELHVGTFTPQGTLDAIIPRLDALENLGITAIALMPIGQFPGDRNWGYDGTYISAVQNSYGGPRALKRLIDAAHQRGLAVVLDAVYNHLGPEGNYLREFGPYFTDRYKTAWGEALNFDGAHSDDVRWFFIHNALMWIDEFHVDALRVDAVHAIVDHSAEPFLQDLTTAVRQAGRPAYSIAESNLNDPRVITPKAAYGLGFDTQWSDDVHHALHTLLTGEKAGYYIGYGAASDLARVMSTGYLYVGQHSVYRGRKYGVKPNTTDGAQFVVFAQNHDQVGNRMHGERLSTLVSPEKLRLAAAVVVLSPFLPMLFMGEEYGETAPFQYFTSHSDPGLIEAVRRGRREEFEDFEWVGEAPDPHDHETFRRSKLNWREDGPLRDLYRDLLRLRRELFRDLDLGKVETWADDTRRLVTVRRGHVLVAFNFSDSPQCVEGVAVPPWDFAVERAKE